jgi:UDP-glucose 4-epimerase
VAADATPFVVFDATCYYTVLRLLEQGYGVAIIDNFHNSVLEALDRVRLIARQPALSARLDFCVRTETMPSAVVSHEPLYVCPASRN